MSGAARLLCVALVFGLCRLTLGAPFDSFGLGLSKGELTQGRQPQPPVQPGARQGGPTRPDEAVPKFNMDYFVGDWAFEWIVPDSPLGPGGAISGTESIKKAWDGRFYELTIKGEGPDGPFNGTGIMIYLDTPAGQHVTRYEVTRGFPLLKAGTLGGDLGGTYSHFWETPPFERSGSTIRLKGRSYFVSPANYRVTTQISINRAAYQNLGTMWYTKDVQARPSAGDRR